MRWLGVLAIVFFADVRTADACAAAPPRGEEVRIAEEEALIVWDPETKTEHFIRRASFHSTARKFGFLVPTPSVPQLSEVPDTIFWQLADRIRPEVIYKTEKGYRLGSFLLETCARSLSKSGDGAAQSPVRVLQTANVAGFDATTVEADDAKALTDWLANHGFEATPQLTAWLERYVNDKGKMTAFVVASGAGDQKSDRYDLATKAVKMTFPAERPFYPYREPKLEMTVETNAKLAPPTADRMLRVFFVSNERYAATLADQPWSAKVLHAGKLENLPAELEGLAGKQRYVTVFVDDSSPRRGIEELYFAPSADKQDVEQPPQHVTTPDDVVIPVDVILVAGLVVFWLVRRRQRRR